MKILGVVRWTHIDKSGHLVARVEPLFEILGADWRPVDAEYEFPTEGRAFWPFAREAVVNGLFFFRAEPNPGQRDEFRLLDAQAAEEVLDLREVGSPQEVGVALATGLRRPTLPPSKAYLWCHPDLLVGPVRLARTEAGITFDAGPRERLRVSKAAAAHLHAVNDRWVCVDGAPGAPVGYVDWDDDVSVVRRALKAAVDRAKKNGANLGLTTALIQEAAAAIVGAGTSADLQLERYRLERASALCADGARIAQLAPTVAEALLTHPAVAADFEARKKELRGEIELELRTKLASEVAAARAELEAVEKERRRASDETTQMRGQLDGLQRELDSKRAAAAAEAASAEDALTMRVREVLERPAAMLAEVALLRPLLRPREVEPTSSLREAVRRDSRTLPTSRGAALGDKLSLQRALNAAFKHGGLAPGPSLRLHACVVAGLLPVVPGPLAITAFSAYARAVCGHRVEVFPVSPSFHRPADLFGSDAEGTFSPHASGLLDARTAWGELDAPSIVVLEGINRAPTESYLVPFLQLRSAGLTQRAGSRDFGLPHALRLGATALAGATSVPVTRDLWSYSALVEVTPATVAASAPPATEVPLSSELFTPGDAPQELVEEILEECAWASDCRPSLERLGAAMARLEPSPEVVRSVLVEAVLVPWVATSPSEEERAEALEGLVKVSPTDRESAPRLAALERRLRARLGWS